MTSFTSTIKKNQFSPQKYLSLGVCIFGLVYFCLGEPRVMSVLAFSTIATFTSFKSIGFLLSKILNKKVKFQLWHFLAVALGITLCFTGLETASHAYIFQTLEDAMSDVLTATGDTISEETITGLFTFFRVILGLSFVAGIVLAIVQATQGQDWRPILNAVAIGVFAVLAIEIMSNLILGTAGTAG